MKTQWIKNDNGNHVRSEKPSIDRIEYEKDLKQRQQEHLRKVLKPNEKDFQPCLHDGCSECIGTGIKKDGSPCIHFISCPCPKCSPRM